MKFIHVAVCVFMFTVSDAGYNRKRKNIRRGIVDDKKTTIYGGGTQQSVEVQEDRSYYQIKPMSDFTRKYYEKKYLEDTTVQMENKFGDNFLNVSSKMRKRLAHKHVAGVHSDSSWFKQMNEKRDNDKDPNPEGKLDAWDKGYAGNDSSEELWALKLKSTLKNTKVSDGFFGGKKFKSLKPKNLMQDRLVRKILLQAGWSKSEDPEAEENTLTAWDEKYGTKDSEEYFNRCMENEEIKKLLNKRRRLTNFPPFRKLAAELGLDH